MVNNIAGYALSIVGAIYIGRLGALQLSASVLANSLYNCTGLSLALGLSAGMETLCGQVRPLTLWRQGVSLCSPSGFLQTNFNPPQLSTLALAQDPGAHVLRVLQSS